MLRGNDYNSSSYSDNSFEAGNDYNSVDSISVYESSSDESSQYDSDESSQYDSDEINEALYG